MTRENAIRWACGTAAAVMAVTLFVGAEAVGQVPLFPPPIDKLAHITYYGLMAALLAHAVGLRWLWLPLVLLAVVGGADEWNQLFTPGRDASIWDWVADQIGAVAFVYAYWRLAMRGRRARSNDAQ